MAKRMNHISLYVEAWVNDLIDLKAKNRGVSKSELIRIILKESLVVTPKKRSVKAGYYNDHDGILRSVKQN